jgi:hypothetical protein
MKPSTGYEGGQQE